MQYAAKDLIHSVCAITGVLGILEREEVLPGLYEEQREDALWL
jgi:hypothetical protein